MGGAPGAGADPLRRNRRQCGECERFVRVRRDATATMPRCPTVATARRFPSTGALWPRGRGVQGRRNAILEGFNARDGKLNSAKHLLQKKARVGDDLRNDSGRYARLRDGALGFATGLGCDAAQSPRWEHSRNAEQSSRLGPVTMRRNPCDYARSQCDAILAIGLGRMRRAPVVDNKTASRCGRFGALGATKGLFCVAVASRSTTRNLFCIVVPRFAT